jgi:protein-tyrosine-phosphatase
MSELVTSSSDANTAAQVVRSALTALVPREARLFARRLSQLAPGARRVFLRQTIRRLARRRRPVDSRAIAGYRHVIFVCHGNILRSPFAAALLRRELGASGPNYTIGSAGLHAQSERPADPRGVVAAQSLGIDLHAHRAALLTKELVDAADVLLVMDFENEAECITSFPQAERKLWFLGAFDSLPARNRIEIPDPYTLDEMAVARCYQHVARCVGGLQAALRVG